MGCVAAENYMLFEIHNWCKWLDCIRQKVANNCKFLYTHYRYKIEQPATRQHNGIKNSKCTCGCSFVKIIWKPLSLKMSTTLRIDHQAVLSTEILREAEAENLL